jgi:CDP-paratose 2-epimerase
MLFLGSSLPSRGLLWCIGDLYFREYARTFGMKTFVFRLSATYGELQYTTEVHGWVGWILKRAYAHKPINIFGDGKQVRGVLHVSDLVRAFEAAIKNINKTRGHAFNIGGDRENSLSILELLQLLKTKFNIEPSKIQYLDWRKIDQKCYIANCKKAHKFFGWKPTVPKEEGIEKMYNWVRSA